jgi:hypothetical protein
MKIKIYKKKILQIMSNGSLNSFYKTSNNLQIYNFFEKDFVNFLFNLKDKTSKIDNDKISSTYKNKYVTK